MQHSESDWQFRLESQIACKVTNDGCELAAGKMLGGSSTMNTLAYVRGNRFDFDQWSQMGNAGWDYESVLPFFKKSEANHFAPFVKQDHGRYHSGTGPLNVDFCGESPFHNIIINAAIENGHPYIIDINGNETIGYTNAQATCYQGRRQSTAKAFLATAKNRRNLNVIKYGLVKEILIDRNGRANGIVYERNGRNLRAFTRKEVHLSAGAIMSPVILMLSGVGPKEHLQQHGIEVKRHLAVGKHLLDHIHTMVMFQFHPTTTQSLKERFFELLLFNSGSLTDMGVSLNAFFNIDDKKAKSPNIQVIHCWITQNSPELVIFVRNHRFKSEISDAIIEINKMHDIALMLVILLHPKSNGHIHLKSASIHDKPIIKPMYFDDDEDMKTMIKAVREQVSYVNSKSFRQNDGQFIHLPIGECAAMEFDTDEYWRCYISYMTSTTFHPVGTLKMGPSSDLEAVVDERLKVRGVDGLRVIDASM